MAVVHSHRHNKEETSEILASDDPATANVDFSLVRDTMYKYSKNAQKRFFENPALAFLFAWFASSQLSFQFIETKYREKGSDYLQRIHAEIDILKEQAMQAMVSESQALSNAAAVAAPPKQQSLMSPLINRFIEVAVGCGSK